MKTEVITECPAFVLHGSSRAGSGETTEVSYTELRQSEVGQTWEAFAASCECRGRHEECATVVYKDEDGVAILFRAEGTNNEVYYKEWRGKPTLKWFEFVRERKETTL